MENLIYVRDMYFQMGYSEVDVLRNKMPAAIRNRLASDRTHMSWRDRLVSRSNLLSLNRELRGKLNVAVKAMLKEPDSMENLNTLYSIYSECMDRVALSFRSQSAIREVVPAIKALNAQKEMIDKGEWQKIPWNIGYAARMPHISTNDPSKIAYNESVQKILKNIQTTCRPGRYLSKFHPDLSDEDVREMVHEFEANAIDFNLEFISNTDPRGWVDAYKFDVQASDSNATSCMSGESCVEVYAHPENTLTLIVLRLTSGQVVARAIGNTQTKRYVRAYTNREHISSNTFISLLEKNGWSRDADCLYGQKLLRIECGDDRLVCPYIDGNADCVSDCDTYLRLGDDGFSANETCGYVELDRVYCEMCNEATNPDDLIRVHGNEHVCVGCCDSHFVHANTRYGMSYVRTEDVLFCESDGEYYEVNEAERLGIRYCDLSGLYYHGDDIVELANGEYAYFDHADVASLDEPSIKTHCTFALKSDTVELSDGRIVYEPDEGYWLKEMADNEAVDGSAEIEPRIAA